MDADEAGDGPFGIWKVIRGIPRGRAAAYGDVGKAMDSPVSGLLVGRWMTRCPEDVPWWRVVGRDGTLLVARRDVQAAVLQQERLESEGVEFVEGRVDMGRFGCLP